MQVVNRHHNVGYVRIARSDSLGVTGDRVAFRSFNPRHDSAAAKRRFAISRSVQDAVAAGSTTVVGDAVNQTTVAPAELRSGSQCAAIDTGICQEGIGGGMSCVGQVGLSGADEPGGAIRRRA